MKNLFKYAAVLLLLFPSLALAQLTTVQGGTGTSSPSGILIGVTGNLHLQTLTVGSNLTLSGTTLSATGGGGGSAFPFTPQTYGNSTSTVIGFLGGLFTNGSTTISSVGSGLAGSNNGLLYSVSTSSLNASITGNAGTVSNGVYTTTFNGLFDNRLSATTSLPNIVTLSSLSLPYSQLTGVPAFDTFAYPFPSSATSSVLTFSGGATIGNNLTLSGLTGGGTLCLHVNNSGIVSTAAGDCGTSGGTITAVTASYPLASSGGTTPNITTAFGTTTNWGVANNAFIYTSNTGIPLGVASSSLDLPNGALQNSTISGVSLGNSLNSLTINNGGSGVASGGTYNGSAGVTISYNSIGAQVAGSYDSVVTASTPIIRTANNLAFVGLATTSQPASSNLLTSNGGAGVYGTATSTLTASSPLTGSFTQVGSGGSLGCQTASGSQAGCLSSADWTTFNNKDSFAWPFTPTSYGNATSSILGFTGGFLAVGSSTIVGNATTTGMHAFGNVRIPSLGVAAGTFLAVDPNGVIIATSTPTGTSGAFSPAANYATVAGLPAYTYVAGVITEVSNGALSVDGNNPTVGQIILVKNESGACMTGSGACNNGLYNVTAAGSGIAAFVLTRNSNYNSSSNVIPGIVTYIISGATLNDDFWALTSAAPITVGTTALNYTEVSGGGAAVTSVSNSDSTLTISPTSGAVVASLNLAHANTWSVLQNFTNATSTFLSSTYASSTTAYFGTLNLPLLTGTQCLHEVSGVVTGTGSDCGSGGGGAAYPFTPLAFGSLTTSATSSALYPYGLVTGTSTIGTLVASSSITNQAVTSALVLDGSGGLESAYGGASACTNQVSNGAISATGGTTCTSINNSYWSGTALAIGNGGTNATSFTANTIPYINAAGTAFTGGVSTSSLVFSFPHTSNPSPTAVGQCSISTNYPYQFQCGNNASGTTVFDPRPAFTLTVASTTALTGTTTAPVFVFPYGVTVTNWACTLQPNGSTGTFEWQYANPTAYTTVTPTYLIGSTTPGLEEISSNNTPSAQATSTLLIGNVTGSPTSASCTFYGNVTAI